MDEDGLGLELGLSLGGAYGWKASDKPARNDGTGWEGKRNMNSITDFGDDASADLFRKREIHALRRREAKMKRVVKQQRRYPLFSAGEQKLKRSRTEGYVKGLNLNLNIEPGFLSDSFLVGGFPALKLAARVAVVESVKNVNIVGSAIQSYGADKTASNIKSQDQCSTEQFLSPSDSSSDASDTSSSMPGGSSDYGSYSQQTRAVNGSPSSSGSQQTETVRSSTASLPAQPAAEISVNPPKANSGQKRLPCVTTTGTGPNGRRVDGFLNRCTQSEISIICVCHGISFSPSEFIKHAGGGDVDRPLRHINVVMSPL